MMKLVSKQSAIVLILFVSSCCNNSKQLSDQIVKEPLSITIELLSEEVVKNSKRNIFDYDGDKPYIDNKNYEVKITFNNNTDSIMHLVLMSCSWDDNIVINTPYISYYMEDCNSNYPRMINIEPHDKPFLIAILEKNIQECETCPKYKNFVDLRMGLIVINERNDYDSIMNDKSAWSIVWSNPITLNKD